MAYKTQNKITNISISKGIGIMLMVTGHIFVCSDNMFIHNFIYAFHMPLFFMCSGFLLYTKLSAGGANLNK